MDIFIWAGVFAAALFVLIKGSDLFIEKAEHIGLHLKLPTFVIGVLIVGVGTSLPELASGFSALLQSAPEIIVANAVGSNIANILLVVGLLSAIGGRLAITKDLLDAELPFFVISTTLFLGIAFDGSITTIEALLLFATYLIYLLYLFTVDKDIDTLVTAKSEELTKERRERFNHLFKSSGMLAFGLAGVLGGAYFLIQSLLVIAGHFGISTSLLSITAVALGTSLPELFVSFQALRRKKVDLAIGNIFGSNAFNILLAVGAPGLFATLPVNGTIYSVGLPVLGAATVIFLVIGLARKIYRWEGFMFLLFYGFFVLKLFGG